MTVTISKTRVYFVHQAPASVSKTRVYFVMKPIFHVGKVNQYIATAYTPSALVRKVVNYIIVGPESTGPTGRPRRVVNIVM